MDPSSNSSSRSGFSRGQFVSGICVIIGGFLAFPLYQFLYTGGPVFYTNGIDESGYLSYPFSSYVTTAVALHRLSSYLILWLHHHGVSGGWCNVLFDVVTNIGIITGVCRLLIKSGYDRRLARCGALLAFLLPLFFSTFNPIFDKLSGISLCDELVQWIVTPFNQELPFARSPEPQLSWLAIVVWLNLFANSRWRLPSALLITPFLYSFVRLPFLFICLAMFGASRWRLASRLVFAWIASSGAVALYRSLSIGPSADRFSYYSHVPMLSVMGVCAVCAFLTVRRFVPAELKTILPILVASTWIGPNVQILSGLFATPVNYEQYWSVVVVSFLTALIVLEYSTMIRCWTCLLVLVFMIQSALVFKLNYDAFAKLDDPKESLQTIRYAADRVAVDDLLLASFLDLAFPSQPATLFSFNKTYGSPSDGAYLQYQCARMYIERHYTNDASRFKAVFERLDEGYQIRGVDILNTAGRVVITRRQLPIYNFDEECSSEPPPIVLSTFARLPLLSDPD